MRREMTGKTRLREAVLLTFALSGAVAMTYATRAWRRPSTAAFAPPVLTFGNFLPANDDRPLIADASTGLIAPTAATAWRQLFALQAAGQWQQAANQMPGIPDTRLRGMALAQRYLNDRAYRASWQELADWLKNYDDEPGAEAIYRLAVARAPAGITLHAPGRADAIIGYLDAFADHSVTYISARQRTPVEKAALDDLVKQIHDANAHGFASKAENLLSHTAIARHLDPIEYDQLRAQIASVFYYAGKPKTALTLAGTSADRSGVNVPLAGWIGGLAAWRQGKYARAAGLFEQVSISPYSSAWSESAGAYWAYRAHSRAGDGRARSWLLRAAAWPRTFYGLLALKTLDQPVVFHWDIPQMTPARLALLAKTPAGGRAIALVAAGQPRLAERELAQINPAGDAGLEEAMLAFTGQAGMPSLAMRLAEAVPHPGGGLYDAALYPISPWTPAHGYKLDRALIHAIVRQESRFDPGALSQSGAFGLMQLMPGTASDVGGDETPSLGNPETNLDLGQRYMIGLLNGAPDEGADMISVIASYNAGPGNVRHWKDQMDSLAGNGRASAKADPLLFLESLPVAQTRNFTERVLANYWIYSYRLGQPAPSLASFAGGKWPRFAAQKSVNDNHAMQLASASVAR